MTESSRFAIAVSSPGEGELFFDELHAHPAFGELAHDPAQVVEGEAVHGVHDDGVAVADLGGFPVPFDQCRTQF